LIRTFRSRSPHIPASAFVAPGAVVLGDVTLGEDASIWYQCVIRGDVHSIQIGARTNVQDLTMVHVTSGRFATRIGDDCTIGHRAIIHGCTVGDRCLIGMGAILLDGVEVGDDCIIGAGAVVSPGTRIPPRSMVLGLPGRVVRTLRDDELAELPRSAERYVSLSREHAALGGP
jgi:carbonic anhydrase/acetyltransferase-like protein (isoleucine patch superfamily)